MTDPTETRLRRLFAEAAGELPGEAFVAAVSAEVASQRRRRRRLLLTAWVAGAIVLSLLLAPLAPSLSGVFSLGQSLTGLPEQVAGTVEMSANGLRAANLPAYAWWLAAGCALPLGVMAWLFRSGRRIF